MMGNDEVIL